MGEPVEVIQRLENGLKPFVKPREQVNYIRRVLALHLGAESQSAPIKHPLSLAGISQRSENGGGEKSIHKEYLDSLQSHVAAKLEFESARRAHNTKLLSSTRTSAGSYGVEDQIDILRLRQKHERLLKVQEYLDSLSQKPACSHDFLDASQIFRASANLPKVPDAVVNSLIAEQNDAPSDLKSKVHELEKTALRAKLLLKQQELLLQDAKSRANRQANTVSHAERLNALSASRNELINWMETELSRASSDDVKAASEGVPKIHDRTGDSSTIKTKLTNIQEKYDIYLQKRRYILSVATHQVHPTIQQAVQQIELSSNEEIREVPVDYLLTPYIGNLLFVAKNLKTDIGYKSHMISVLKQHSRETQQALHHLAEESQLLPAHPSQKQGRVKGLIRHESSHGLSDSQDLISQIQPWVVAADSAKIVTLESVTETVEAGQVALESFMKTIQAIRQLLGHENLEYDMGPGEAGSLDQEDDDLWLKSGGQADATTEKCSKRLQSESVSDVWSKLRGNLGLISHDELS